MPELLQDYVTRCAERRPEDFAVVLNEETLSYGQLEATSNQLARLLCDGGCQRGDRVCFLVPKSPLAITCMVAILKSDCIHVPLDTTNPAARIVKIIRSCQPRMLLAAGPVDRLVRELWDSGQLANVTIAWLDSTPSPQGFPASLLLSDLATYSTAHVFSEHDAQSPSHILFTSGSTGTPKGVVITHSNVIHFIEWATRYFGIDATDRISGHSPLYFDLSQFDIFGTFAVGAQLHLISPQLNLLPNKLAEFIRRSKLTQWFSVPSVLHYMAKYDVVRQGDFPSLKRVLWCGETLATPTLIHWMQRLPHTSFTNLYGPTETTIASSFYTVPVCPVDDHASIPIGRSCDGEYLMVLDQQLRALPVNEIGELYIGGVGVSSGYWQDPEKTNAAFRTSIQSTGCDRIYKTGDLAKVGRDGFIYLIGRADSQVKCRGYRIELGEIEAALNTLQVLRECAVLALPTPGFEGTRICCAYASKNGPQSAVALQTQLQRLLPRYMIPSRWIAMNELPKNTNGKIDRAKLRRCFSAVDEESAF
jgi:amino acid adenylation domain-containing protein